MCDTFKFQYRSNINLRRKFKKLIANILHCELERVEDRRNNKRKHHCRVHRNELQWRHHTRIHDDVLGELVWRRQALSNSCKNRGEPHHRDRDSEWMHDFVKNFHCENRKGERLLALGIESKVSKYISVLIYPILSQHNLPCIGDSWTCASINWLVRSIRFISTCIDGTQFFLFLSFFFIL